MSQESDPRPPLGFMARSGFDQLEWTPVLTPEERRDLEHWASNLDVNSYAFWYQWAAEHHRYQIYHILRDPLPPTDPRVVPAHVETRAMRRRRALIEQEPEPVYRIRTRMEADLRGEVEEEAAFQVWWVEWERRRQERVEEERRQRAREASCSFRRRCERANEARARMRRRQAEERADAQAEEEGESSGSNDV